MPQRRSTGVGRGSPPFEARGSVQPGRATGRAAALTPAALVYELVTASDPQLSPDGTRIAYALHTVEPASRRARSQVWVCGADGGQPRALTSGHERAGGARWSPDGTQLAFTMASPRGGTGVFLRAADRDDEPREITRHAHDVGELAWSPDGRRLAYTTVFDPDNPDNPDNPDEHGAHAGAELRVRVTRRLDYKQDGRGFVGDARQQVFVVDLETGTRRRLTGDPVDHASPAWSPDGRWLLVHAPRASDLAVGGRTTAGLLLVDAGTGSSRVVTPSDVWVEQAAWSPAGDRIVFAADPLPRSFQADVFVHHLASGATRRLTDDLPSSLSTFPPAPLVWLDERRVLCSASRAGASGLEVVDTATGAVETLWRDACRHAGMSVDRARRQVVQVRSTLTEAPELWVYDLARGVGRTITAYNTRLLEARPPAQWERLELPRGAFTVEAWLLKPPDFDPAKRYPLVLDIHGGPASHYGYAFMALQQCLATHGFLVVFANPRGSTSYGRRFTQAVDWGGEDYRDCLAAVDAVLGRPYADPDRVGIYGYSYGGYLCAWAITQTDRFRAAVCGSMFFDLASSYGTADNRGIAAYAGGPPHLQPDWYAAHSPSTFAHQARTPTLLIHGEADERIPDSQAEQMFVALKDAGCEVELALYPGASHLFLFFGLPEQRLDFLARILAWFSDRLGGPR